MQYFNLVIQALMALAVLLLPVYAIGCLLFALRNRLPDVDLAWTLKTGLSRHNFTPRGQALRRRSMLTMLSWLGIIVLGNLYVRAAPLPRDMRGRTAATRAAR